jgi:hypothetical protein
MNYHNLTIHQRITARANALKYYAVRENGLFRKVVKGHPDLFTYFFPAYLVQYKTNGKDGESVPQVWWGGGFADNH